MAQYFTNFSEYTTGQQPSDWTLRWVTTSSLWRVREVAGTIGGKVLRKETTASAARRAISWDAIDADANRANTEVLMKFRFLSIPQNAEVDCVAMMRGSGSAASETGYLCQRRIVSATQPVNRLSRYVGGSFTELSADNTTIVEDQWYWMRARINGSVLSIRSWTDGDAEPGTWTLQETDGTPITDAGWVGLFAIVGADRNREYDYFAVGTDGDTAPSPVLPNTVISTVLVDEAGDPLANVTGLRYLVSSSRTPDGVADANVLDAGDDGATDGDGKFELALAGVTTGDVVGLALTGATGSTGPTDSHRGVWRVLAVEDEA